MERVRNNLCLSSKKNLLILFLLAMALLRSAAQGTLYILRHKEQHSAVCKQLKKEGRPWALYTTAKAISYFKASSSCPCFTNSFDILVWQCECYGLCTHVKSIDFWNIQIQRIYCFLNLKVTVHQAKRKYVFLWYMYMTILAFLHVIQA